MPPAASCSFVHFHFPLIYHLYISIKEDVIYPWVHCLLAYMNMAWRYVHIKCNLSLLKYFFFLTYAVLVLCWQIILLDSEIWQHQKRFKAAEMQWFEEILQLQPLLCAKSWHILCVLCQREELSSCCFLGCCWNSEESRSSSSLELQWHIGTAFIFLHVRWTFHTHLQLCHGGSEH